MPKFLVAIHHPEGYDDSKEDAAMGKAIDDLNDEMVAAGVRVFVGGLQPPSSAVSVTADSSGSLVESQGLYLQTKDYVGGFWVLDVASKEEAIEWGRKAVVACRAPVEVRPFY